MARVLCGKQLAESSDREIWKQAVADLVGICHRNSFGDEELTREVGTALPTGREAPRASRGGAAEHRPAVEDGRAPGLAAAAGPALVRPPEWSRALRTGDLLNAV